MAGCCLLDQLGYDAAAFGGLKANIALEREIFLVDREEYVRRPDLQFTGRTMDKLPRATMRCATTTWPP